ncbi:MAG: sensor histidine kinase [Phycisphaerae bacterium]|nr:sensor histidine kinase [Phycisphaerae bacterium]
MKFGIRTKLILLLVAVALLPLLTALLVIVVGERQFRSKMFRQGMLSLVTSEARVLETELEKDTELLRIALQEPQVVNHLREVKPRSDKETERIDREWSDLPAEHRVLRETLQNDVAAVLRVIQQENLRLAELLVTDRQGRLVAATNRTTDFDQSDETWWQEAYHQGKGQIFIPYVTYDRSAQIWAVYICIPILDGEEIVGMAKAVLDLNRWLPNATRNVGGGWANLVMLGEDGHILYSKEILERQSIPMKDVYPDAREVTAVGSEGQWRITDENIEAYAPLLFSPRIGSLNVKVSPWILLAYMPLSEARKGLAELTLVIVLVGLVLIGALFFGGVLLVDRSVINRIRNISSSARYVAEGELKHRADASWAGTRVLGTDEIDDLARDFNNMVRKLQRSHTELIEANKLKENFIRIAGHELRTPVSYIVGMASLMKTVQDPERLLKAIDTMGFKASRLDEIIQAMFKLIPDQTLVEGLRYEPVNLSRLLEKVYLDLQPWIERRKQRLVIEPGEGETIIQADASKLRDVVENLAMNAIKFTPNNGVVKVTVQRQLGGHVAIEVIDQGPGIPETDRPHIFEPFYSGSDVLRHSTGKSGYGKRGMGLGLAIVKHFVDLHGGTIEFTTRPSGTTFIVQLPIEPAPGHR